MPIHINDFDKPSALEEKRLKALTGCPLSRRIDSVCSEPGCPNNGLLLQILEEARMEECLQDPAITAPQDVKAAPAVYQTEPKQRCIL